MDRAALYIRVSTQEQAVHGLSLQAQKEDLEKYAKQHNMNVVGLYADEGFSARKPSRKRSVLQRLLDDVKADKIDIILFIRLDRWFRNVGDYYKVQEILDEHHVNWRCTQEEYDTSTASGRLKINIMLSVAQDEADRTSERIKFIIKSKKERNEVCTGHLPKGYKTVGKTVVIDEEYKPIVEKFFSTFIETGSVYEAINSAPELHLQYRSARLMLDNKGFLGDWHGLTIPPYLTQEQFEKIQSLRKKTARKAINDRTYIFSGIVFCAECGLRYCGRPRKLKNGENYTYQCRGHSMHTGCKNKTCVLEHVLESYLLNNIDSEIMNFKSEEAPTPDRTKQIASLKQKLSRLNDLYIDGSISKDDHDKKYNTFTQNIIELEREQAKPRAKNELKQQFQTGWQDTYMMLDNKSKQIFWRSRIKEIRIHQDRHFDIVFL